MTLLRIKDLCVHYITVDGVAKVLNEVNLDVNEGESIALVGESGCGKTTVLRTILGILPENARIVKGKIIFKGVNILSLSREEFYKLKGSEFAYIPQEPITALNLFYTIGDQFTDVLLLKGTTKINLLKYLKLKRELYPKLGPEVIKYLKIVKIPEPERVVKSYPFQLSGGMLQRVLIAMAIAKKPSLLLADEPTTALDVITQKEILDLLKSLKRELGISMMYVTHNLGVAKEVSDRIVVMYGGEVIEIASTEELLEQPLHPYTKGLIGAIPKLTITELKPIEGGVIDYYNPPPGCRFYPRCPLATEICKLKRPSLIEVSKGHLIACHRIKG